MGAAEEAGSLLRTLATATCRPVEASVCVLEALNFPAWEAGAGEPLPAARGGRKFLVAGGDR